MKWKYQKFEEKLKEEKEKFDIRDVQTKPAKWNRTPIECHAWTPLEIWYSKQRKKK